MHRIHPSELIRMRNKFIDELKTLLCEEGNFQLPHLCIAVLEDLQPLPSGLISMTYTIKKGIIQKLREHLRLPESATALEIAIKLHGEDVVCAFRAVSGTMIRMGSDDKTIDDLRPEIEEIVRNAERGKLGVQAIFLTFYCTTGRVTSWALPYVVENKKITFFELEEMSNETMLGEIPFKGEG